MLCSTSAILRGTEPFSVLTHAPFILLRSLQLFFFLDFVSGYLAQRKLR